METNEHSRRLLITAKPKHDESFTSYVLRLTELNLYDHPSWILELAGAVGMWVNGRCSFTFGKSPDWGCLSEVTGISADILMLLSYSPTEDTNTTVVFGQVISQYLIRLFKPKVCPSCLRETHYCRKLWDLAFITSCDAHKCLLLDECPNCHKPISLLRNKVCICRCEFDWREADASPVEESELKIVRHMRRHFGLADTGGRKKWAGIGQPFDELSLEVFLTSIFFIMGQQRGVLDTKGKRTATFRRNAELHRSLIDAFAVFENWPENFFEFLDWRRRQGFKSRYDGKTITGVHKEFGTFHQGLSKQLLSADYDYLRRAYKEYLATRWDGGVMRSPLVRGITFAKSKYVAKTEAQKILSIDTKWIIKLIETGKLKGIIRQRKHSRLILIERESITALKRVLDEYISTDDVAKQLGIGYGLVMELVKQGCLEPIRGPEIDGFANRQFNTSSVEELLSRLRSKLDPGALVAGDDVVVWSRAVRMLKTCRIHTVKLVRAILNDEIVPCRESSGIGFKRFRFAGRTIRNYLQAQFQGERHDRLHIIDAAKLMGLHKSYGYALVRRGLIHAQTINADNSRSKVLVTKESLDLFNATYTFAFRLARQQGISSQKLTGLLIANGIMPVSGRNVDGGSQYIFRNDDLQQVDIKALLTK